MNKLILTNAVWLAVAGAMFAVGRITTKPSGDPGADGASHRKVLTTINKDKDSEGKSPKGSGESALDEDFLARYLEGEGGVLTSSRMSEAMREAMAENDPVKRSLMMAQLLQNLSAENVEAALEAMRESPDRRENFQYMALLQYAWGKIDGEAALASAQEIGGRGAAFASMSALSGWAVADPDAAKQWVESQEDGREKMMYLNGLVEGMAKTDPAAATAYVLSMAAPAEGEGYDARNRYIGNIAGEMLKQGVDAASAWAAGLPEGSLRASALGEVADYYARQDPAEAAKWIESLADSADSSAAVGEIAGRMARENPASAAEWVNGLPEAAQSQAMRSVFDRWANDDAVGASEFLAAMDQGSGRDSAVSGFARELAGDDPSSAIEWASSIADDELRTSTELSVARSWYREEPEAAQEWAASNLPEESQQAITQRGRGDGGGGGDRGGGPRGRGR